VAQAAVFDFLGAYRLPQAPLSQPACAATIG
jgi:hypothetical protein